MIEYAVDNMFLVEGTFLSSNSLSIIVRVIKRYLRINVIPTPDRVSDSACTTMGWKRSQYICIFGELIQVHLFVGDTVTLNRKVALQFTGNN